MERHTTSEVERHTTAEVERHTTSEGCPQGNLGTLATLLPELLERILSFADRRTKLELSRACKGLHDALLARTAGFNGKEPRTELTLHTEEREPVAAARTLQMAAHAAHNVALYVWGQEPYDTPTDPVDQAWLEAVLQPWLPGEATPTVAAGSKEAAAAAQITSGVATGTTPSLQPIKSIGLHDMHLDHPFPTCIGQAFPFIECYLLREVTFHSTAAGGLLWPKLKTLQMEGYASLQLPRMLGPNNFPALVDLHLSRIEGQFRLEEQDGLLPLCLAFSQQLTSLYVGVYIRVGGVCTYTPAVLGRLFHNACFPQLTCANLTWMLTDVEFCELLGACPSLKRLSVGFLELKEEHGDKHDSLETLSINDKSGDGLLRTLSLLPRTPKVLKVSLHPWINISWTVDPQVLAAAVARVRLSQLDVVTLRCTHMSDWSSLAISNVTTLCPLLQALRADRFVLKYAHISEPLLVALSLLGMVSLKFDNCTWEPEVAVRFWLLMPAIRDVRFDASSTHGMTECLEHVLSICCMAVHPVTVQVQSRDVAEQQRIRLAVQEAGKEDLITLIVPLP